MPIVRLIALLLLATPLAAQTVQVLYQGSAPYSGSVPVQVSVTGLPAGCSVGTPTYAGGTIAVPVNCGTPPPVGTTCASPSTPLTGCAIGNTVAVVSNPGNVRGTPTPSGGNGPLMGTQNAGATGVVVTNPIPQTGSTTGWQVVNFGAPNSCNPLGPYGPNCGYIGNNNIKPSGVTPPPVTTCNKSLPPSGSQDNAAVTAALAAVGSNGCVYLQGGTWNFAAWQPCGNLVTDDAAVIQDFGIFPRTTPFFNITCKFSIVGAGPKFTTLVKMPVNYANAQKENQQGQDYEYQHCFALNGGVSGVVISNINLQNCGGDGITFVNTTGATVTNVNTATNIRQGMAVTGPATNVVITGGNLHDGPLSGLDVEPDAGITGNIQMVINGLHTTNNKGGGRSYGLMNLTPATNVNIVDNNPVSTNDTGIGIAFWNRNSGTNVNATGSVTVNNFTVTGATTNCTGGAKSTDGFKVIFNGGTCTNSGQAALMVKVDGGETGTPGGVSWSGITINGTAPALSLGNAAQTTVSNSTYNGKAVSYP